MVEQHEQHGLMRDHEFAREHDADFHTRDVHEFDHAEFARWREGRWHNIWHNGRWGWWWRVHDTWYWYREPLIPIHWRWRHFTWTLQVEVPALVELPPIEPLPAPSTVLSAASANSNALVYGFAQANIRRCCGSTIRVYSPALSAWDNRWPFGALYRVED